ncbi:glycosyltransferase [Chitinimonas taiwanensis]|uniref:glycosyltransferase n=1 Tax=Chitinimonas taiwanensis TaxID=240412 RepID=UPI0035AEC669
MLTPKIKHPASQISTKNTHQLKILQITDVRFWREEFGSQQRISTLTQHLINKGHHVHTLFLGRLTSEDAYNLSKETELTYHPGIITQDAPTSQDSFKTRFKQLILQAIIDLNRKLLAPSLNLSMSDFFLRSHEPKLRDFHSLMNARLLEQVEKQFRPDIVILHFVRQAWLLKQLRHPCLKIVDTHDIQYLRQRLFHQHGEIHDLDITPKEEREALLAANLLIAIQANDARCLQTLLPEKSIVICMHPHQIEPSNPNPRPGFRVGFIGSDMPPNRDAITRIINTIWPQVRDQLPNSELHLYGRSCLATDSLPASLNVTAHGFVENLTGIYQYLDIVINPVRYGGGLKIKNVEALCHGKALITTSNGAEGIRHGAGSAFLMHDQDGDFAHQIVSLLRDSTRRTTLEKAALAFARIHFSPSSTFNELDERLGQHAQSLGKLQSACFHKHQT